MKKQLKALSYSRCINPEEAGYGTSFITEVIKNNDPRAFSPEMQQAIQKEVKGLIDAGTFKIILRENVLRDATILPRRFVQVNKSTVDNELKYKARFVFGRHRDKLKHMMVHNSATLQL